jgi:TfoX/Sxy family transcriptional regulator of competence genes
MSYDERLADRVRAIATELRKDVAERAMFGGLCFTRGGKMFAGIVGEQLMVRVGPDGYDAALAEPHVREMDFTGKPMRGYVYVEASGLRRDEKLRDWIARGLAEAARVGKRGSQRGRARRG